MTLRKTKSGAMAPEVEQILSQEYAGYQEPLRYAWGWNREGSEESWRKAEQLTRELVKRYPYALQARYELAFSLVKQKQRDEAIQVLEQAKQEFPELDEDALSLIARCYKNEGDEGNDWGEFVKAEEAYRRAEEAYEKAYKIRGDRFPGINVATLRLIRAALLARFAHGEEEKVHKPGQAAQTLQAATRELARELLDQRSSWPERLPDDRIWTGATVAEAHLLLEEWDEAARNYRAALDPDNSPLPHHFDSMETQVQRIMGAFRQLGISKAKEFEDPKAFFDQLRKLNAANG